MSSSLLNAWAAAFLPRFHDGLLPYEFLRDLLHTLYYPGVEENTPRVSHSSLNVFGEGAGRA